MSKAEALMEGVTQDVITYLVEDERLELPEALDRLYSSQTYERLPDPETGLYRESSAYLYELLKDELSSGRFAQSEV
jgi:hypothetical protein